MYVQICISPSVLNNIELVVNMPSKNVVSYKKLNFEISRDLPTRGWTVVKSHSAHGIMSQQ